MKKKKKKKTSTAPEKNIEEQDSGQSLGKETETQCVQLELIN